MAESAALLHTMKVQMLKEQIKMATDGGFYDLIAQLAERIKAVEQVEDLKTQIKEATDSGQYDAIPGLAQRTKELEGSLKETGVGLHHTLEAAGLLLHQHERPPSPAPSSSSSSPQGATLELPGARARNGDGDGDDGKGDATDAGKGSAADAGTDKDDNEDTRMKRLLAIEKTTNRTSCTCSTHQGNSGLESK